jgi:hypothetical protein
MTNFLVWYYNTQAAGDRFRDAIRTRDSYPTDTPAYCQARKDATEAYYDLGDTYERNTGFREGIPRRPAGA